MTAVAEREARLAFKTTVVALDRRCRVHDDPADCYGDLQVHHIVSQQHLRKYGLHEYLWDPRGGMLVCEGAHGPHTRASHRISRSRLPVRCFEFIELIGLADWYLDRYYAL